MIPTHATKAGIRYRYYVSLPHLKGESKTISVGSVSRIPATDIEDIIVKSVNEHLIAQKEKSASDIGNIGDRQLVLEQVARVVVHDARLVIGLRAAEAEEASDSGGGSFALNSVAEAAVQEVPADPCPARHSQK